MINCFPVIFSFKYLLIGSSEDPGDASPQACSALSAVDMTTLGIDILRRSAWSLGEGSPGIWWNTWEKSIFDSDWDWDSDMKCLGIMGSLYMRFMSWD